MVTDERVATYRELRRQKGLVEDWLDKVQWPKDREVSRILDHILDMIDRQDHS